MAGSIIDIHEQTLAEAQLRDKNEEPEDLTKRLQRSNKELEQFAYVASHDLQESLRIVGSYMQLLEQRYKDKLDDDAREFIKYAVDGARHMKTLIQDLLSFSRIGKTEDTANTVKLGTVLKRAFQNLRFAIGDSKAIFTNDSLPLA